MPDPDEELLFSFGAFLESLPDAIERSRDRRMPITFPASALPRRQPRRAAVIALLETLGVEIVEEPDVVGGLFWDEDEL